MNHFPILRRKRGVIFFLVLFAVGAVGYFSLEVAFRGFSHWSMALCGGLCLCLIYPVNRRMQGRPLVLRAMVGALIITLIELAAGCILNLYLHWAIWDYSHLPLNLWGQITPVFSGIWFLLCLPVCFLFSLLDERTVRRAEATAKKAIIEQKRKGLR